LGVFQHAYFQGISTYFFKAWTMATYRLHELAEALVSSFGRSQKKIDRHMARGIGKVIQMDNQGRPESLVWECRVPTGTGEDQTFEMLRLPWTSLTQTQGVKISEISITLDCNVEKKPSTKEGADQTKITTPPKALPGKRKKNHLVKLCVTHPQEKAVVFIDKKPIEDFHPGPLSDGQAPEKSHRKKRTALRLIWLIPALIFTLAGIVFYFINQII